MPLCAIRGRRFRRSAIRGRTSFGPTEGDFRVPHRTLNPFVVAVRTGTAAKQRLAAAGQLRGNAFERALRTDPGRIAGNDDIGPVLVGLCRDGGNRRIQCALDREQEQSQQGRASGSRTVRSK